jgi:hypothetical protein
MSVVLQGNGPNAQQMAGMLTTRTKTARIVAVIAIALPLKRVSS